MAGIQRIFGLGAVNAAQGVTNPYQINRTTNNFVKESFNFGVANPNQPYGVVERNALGDPTKGTKLYCLG